MTYKVGDLILSEGGQSPDLAEIKEITETDVIYRWLGMHNMPIYDFNMPINLFNDGLIHSDVKLIPCDSEQQKLVILLKYS